MRDVLRGTQNVVQPQGRRHLPRGYRSGDLDLYVAQGTTDG